MSDLFGAGTRAAPLATTMTIGSSSSPVVVDHQIRCCGEWRGKLCGWLWTERYAARPWAFVCPRCRTVNGSSGL